MKRIILAGIIVLVGIVLASVFMTDNSADNTTTAKTANTTDPVAVATEVVTEVEAAPAEVAAETSSPAVEAPAETQAFSTAEKLVLDADGNVVRDDPADRYPESLLYDKPIKIADNIYSAIGALQPYTYENSGHNNNLSYVIGEQGILVVNGGSSYLLAKALHDEIKKVSDKPVLYVVDENAQAHAVLGNNYWKEQGAKVIAHIDAANKVEETGAELLLSMQNYAKEKAAGTELVAFDETFDKEYIIDLGGITAHIMHFGQAHSYGDVSVYVPERNVLIAGDIAFHQRMLPIFEDTSTLDWLETWKDFAAFAQDKVIVPGHGTVTDFATVDEYTRGYIEYLHGEVRQLLEDGGTLGDVSKIDQSKYRHLYTYEELAALNASRAFAELEME